MDGERTMYNNAFPMRFAGPHQAVSADADPINSRRNDDAGGALDVTYQDHVRYTEVLPDIDRLCRLATERRNESEGDWRQCWEDCRFKFDQWRDLMRKDLSNNVKGATGITAANLGHDYRAFLSLDERCPRPHLQARLMIRSVDAANASFNDDDVPLEPTAPSMPSSWFDAHGVAWPPSDFSDRKAPSLDRTASRP